MAAHMVTCWAAQFVSAKGQRDTVMSFTKEIRDKNPNYFCNIAQHSYILFTPKCLTDSR